MRLTSEGQFRRPQTETFSFTTAEQVIPVNEPTLMFSATIPIFPAIWARAYDFFAGGEMEMKAKILSTLTVVDESETPNTTVLPPAYRADYATAAARMEAAGPDSVEIEAYGHLMDGLHCPRHQSTATNQHDDACNSSLANSLRFDWSAIEVMRAAAGKAFIIGIRMVADEQWDKGLGRAEGIEIARRLAGSGPFDFITPIRGRIDTNAALPRGTPIQGMASAPHLGFAGDVGRKPGSPF